MISSRGPGALLALFALVTTSSKAQQICPDVNGPIECDLKTTLKEKWAACGCARMAYIVATYRPAPEAGVEALDKVCSWWELSGELGQDPDPEIKSMCTLMAMQLRAKTWFSREGWDGALKECCRMFSYKVTGSLKAPGDLGKKEKHAPKRYGVKREGSRTTRFRFRDNRT
jgi:hypothetical protein